MKTYLIALFTLLIGVGANAQARNAEVFSFDYDSWASGKGTAHIYHDQNGYTMHYDQVEALYAAGTFKVNVFTVKNAQPPFSMPMVNAAGVNANDIYYISHFAVWTVYSDKNRKIIGISGSNSPDMNSVFTGTHIHQKSAFPKN